MKKRLHPQFLSQDADVANLNTKSSNFQMIFSHTSYNPPISSSLINLSYTYFTRHHHTSVLPPFLGKPESTLGERFEDYLSLHGQPSEYGYEELGDFYFVFEWIASWLAFGRPKGGIHLYLYVLPQDQKELFVKLLSPVFRILFLTNSNRTLLISLRRFLLSAVTPSSFVL